MENIMKVKHGIPAAIICAIICSGLAARAEAAGETVKVFILAGQSNMEGHGQVRSLPVLGEHPKYGYLLKKLQREDGTWAVRDDVTIAWKAKEKKYGPLTVGWGMEDHEIGPELMFEEHVTSGAVQVIFENREASGEGLYAVFPPGRFASPGRTAFVNFLVDHLGGPPGPR